MTFNLPYTTTWSALQRNLDDTDPAAEEVIHDEDVGTRILRSIEPAHESMSIDDFTDRTVEFLGSIGIVHVARVEADGTGVYSIQEGTSFTLSEVKEEAHESIHGRRGPVKRVEWKAFGRSDHFFLDISLIYRREHSPLDPGLQLTVKSKPVGLDPKEGESAGDYQQRLEGLSSSQGRFKKFTGDTGQLQTELESDLAHHLSQAFPDLTFRVSGSGGPGTS